MLPSPWLNENITIVAEISGQNQKTNRQWNDSKTKAGKKEDSEMKNETKNIEKNKRISNILASTTEANSNLQGYAL